MKYLTKKFLFLILLSSIVVFVFYLNLKIIFLSPEHTKKFINNSKAYSVISVGLKENIVSQLNLTKNAPQVAPAIEAIVSEDSVRKLFDGIIDQVFVLIKSPSKDPKIVIKLSDFKIQIHNAVPSSIPTDFGEIDKTLSDQTMDLGDNPVAKFLLKSNQIFVISGITLLLSLILLLLFDSWPVKIKRIGKALFVAGLVVLPVAFIFFSGLPKMLFNKAQESLSLSDSNFLLGLRGIVDHISQYEKNYYITAVAVLLIAGILLFILGAILNKIIKKPANIPLNASSKPSNSKTPNPKTPKTTNSKTLKNN